MKLYPKTFLFLFIALFSLQASAQKKNTAAVKFGDITAKDFAPEKYEIDSNAQAVILYDAGSAEYVSNGAWFSVRYTYTKRVRLLNKNAFDAATVQIPLFMREEKDDKIEKLEAVTYNINAGIVNKTALDKASLFTDKADKDYTIKKFTLPDLREGCIIEYKYTIVSQAPYTLRGWTFQDRYPVLKSEYEVTIPTLFEFVFLNTGYYDLTPVSKEEGSKIYDIVYRDNTISGKTETYTYNAITLHPKWSLSNLPAMVKENYTTTLKNHIAKIEFQLKSLNMPGSDPKPYLGTWEQLAEELLKDKQFGADLYQPNGWLDADIKKAGVSNDTLATAKNIFSFVRDNYVCTDREGIYMPENLKKVYRDKKGNVAEINLLLTAMLLKANIAATPVLLSTTENGHAYEAYPLINKFNYVIVSAEIGGKRYLLDASGNKNGFDHLPANCYNGSGRLLNATPKLISLSPDSITEVKFTLISINNEDGGKKISGFYKSSPGNFESAELREKIAAEGKAAFFKQIKSKYNFDTKFSEESLDSLNDYDNPITVHYAFDVNIDESLIYFNPLLSEGYKSNPFKAATRNYPVEMPYKTDEMIILTMDIPEGYAIEELPKSQRIRLGEKDAIFEYLSQVDATTIQLRCRLTINKTVFASEDYDALRNFFEKIVKKESEQIVFRKK